MGLKIVSNLIHKRFFASLVNDWPLLLFVRVQTERVGFMPLFGDIDLSLNHISDVYSS